MSSCKVLLGPNGGEVIESDLVVSGSPKMGCEVSKYPIENGSQLSDHVTLQNRGMTLELFFSSRPDRNVQPAGPNRTENARRRLMLAAHRGEIVRVEWDYRTFYPAVLTSVSSPRDANSDGRWVTIEVEELQVAESETVQVPKSRLKSGVRHKGRTRDKGAKANANLAIPYAILTAKALFNLPIPVYAP